MVSRRSFLKAIPWAPLLCSPRSLCFSPFQLTQAGSAAASSFASTDFRLTPRYPAKSPLDDVLRHLLPGSDEYVTEKYAFEIMALLAEWARELKAAPPALSAAAKFLSESVEGAALRPAEQIPVRSQYGIEVVRSQFASSALSGRDRFLAEIKAYFSPLARLETAEFEILAIEEAASSGLTLNVEILYTLIGTRTDAMREQRIGKWLTQWLQDGSKQWQAVQWKPVQETVSRGRGPMFVDVTSKALGEEESYRDQMLRSVDDWRSVLDSACGMDIYGNNGVAVGDFDNDGLDDIYVCQPAGLPNRLYRNRGDGTFEDVTEKAGLGVLDATACALFADFENKGVQDLLVVCNSGPLLFLNQGNGKFSIQREAFLFEHPPQGIFTHAAIADYDRDGRLDIYFCLYNYYLGLEQYRYPVPYFDARNGPPNFLFRNEGNAKFRDKTEAAGLNVDNDRYSFACAWGDHNGNGWPDLYVANDFGRNNLYRNNGDGTFTAISCDAGVEDVGAGMGVCWFDFDNDGNQDIYVADMWSAPGIRVSQQKVFHEEEPESIRALYRRHARGNALYHNRGNGHFENVSSPRGVDIGRWAWSSDAWDFDHDGYPDLYLANGYISGADHRDLGSFFWRHVAGKSPHDATPSLPYEQAWNAINELIRSDCSWAGYERNVFFVNNQNGTFSDISGITGVDFPDDSRSFALADLDGDGRLEIVLKNRTRPQLRILHNAMNDIGRSIAFRLRGQKSNRDAIGAAVTVEAGGHRQTKYLQAGSGFLSQHTKELFFGVGKFEGNIRATIRWPSGLTQSFERLPAGHQVQVEEGSEEFLAKPFSPISYLHPDKSENSKAAPLPGETWLLMPWSAPDFSLPDLAGTVHDLRSRLGGLLLLNFWDTASPASREQMRLFGQHRSALDSKSLRVVTVNVDEHRDMAALRSFVDSEAVSFPVLLASDEVSGVYNILYRYLYDRRRNLPLPSSFLVDEHGMIIKVYQDLVRPDRLLEDLSSIPTTPDERIRKGLPFDGTQYLGNFQRNDFTFGVALFQHGYLEQAAASFRQVIAEKPDNAEAYYNLGTLYLRQNQFQEARRYLEQTVKLRSNYPEAWNNLGMAAAQEGQTDEAVRNFRESLRLRPDYAVALLNLGNIYRRQGTVGEAEKLLTRALEVEPENPEVNYSLGMLYGQQDKIPRALEFFDKALSVRPDYPDALNNLGVVLVHERRFSEAEQKFKACIDAAPKFDQAYLNLARLYVLLNEKDKAQTVLQTLLRGQPQHKLAQQMLETLH
ncbi:MAG TPA: FG-GAP-like repeat-containing protein [Terriglobales bacterium]|nr:FG-GAP-like repeat-containing protein [Terriglobales bacterium]